MLSFKAGKKCLFFIFAMTLFVQPLSAKVEKSCIYRTFNIKIAKDVSVSDLLNEIGNMCHFSITTKDAQTNKLLAKKLNGVNIKNMSLHEVFGLILSENGINYTLEKNILKLSSVYTEIFKIDYITSIREGTAILNASATVEPVEFGEEKQKETVSDNSIKVTERFDFWETLQHELYSLLNGKHDDNNASKQEDDYVANLIINKNTGMITVTGTKKQIDLTRTYLKELKKRLHKQVMIEVSIIAVELSNNYTRGIDWSKFQLSINKFGKDIETGEDISTGRGEATFLNTLHGGTRNLNIITNLHFSMEGLINFIKKKGNSRVLSNPKVMTLNNQQALITIGDNINYRIKEETERDEFGTTVTYTPYTIFIGVLLNLLPEVSEDDKIMLRINPSLSSFKYEDDNKKQYEVREIAPDTSEKKLSTVVQVNSGDTIILGGLIGQTKGKENTSVPLLSSVPILGNAFKSTSDNIKTTELVFVITPHVINPSESKNISTSLKELGFSESLYE